MSNPSPSNPFTIGNKEAFKWTPEEVEKVMLKMLDNAKHNDDILCLQDAIHSVDLYVSSLNYLIDKYSVFENIKNDIRNIIISRVNKGAIKGDFNPAASIWRMKQCGEKDESAINHQNDGGKFNDISALTTAELVARANAAKQVE